jgi:SAM-dependent methyltransferase
LALILERLFAATPPRARQRLRKLKYYIMGRMSPAAYWNMAARISAKAAICNDCVDEEEFFASGQREASLLRRKQVLGPGVHVVNIGCGIGRIENAICSEVASVLGVDVSSQMVELARRKVPAPNVRFLTVDGKSLKGVESRGYDLVISFMVFQHLPRPFTASYMSEVARVLKPGGRFLFQLSLRTPGRGSEPPADHPFGCRFYSPEEVSELLRGAGLQWLEHFDGQGNPAPARSVLEDTKFDVYLARRPFKDA